MLANKTIRFAVVAAVFMLIATVQAALAETSEREACALCENPGPFCKQRCAPGWWCDFNDCTCKWYCRKGPIP
ncbi:hypothetical protein BG006_000093 [Podila minutissima]|uniref:Uncharacterized protein n=1 Tax=Podila minutissima TaxID=64525 RepID=A0A9P5SCC8_9FUNG|nr:hypothetical protein BG006_000093 [Podila minutissima]